jgi:hypothetical protein
LKELHLRFEYERPKKLVYDWWTDLSGTGYVGRALKSARPIGKEGEKLLVETKWTMMGMTITLVEKLTLRSEDHWTWEPHLFGIYITDEFRLAEEADGRTTLKIDSTSVPLGMKGKVMHFMLGRNLDKMMVEEWESASRAFLEETATHGPTKGS